MTIVCAVFAGDEETCVNLARYFMKDSASASDSSRMFATFCRLSQKPVFWYSSGPSQKYVLRQIKAMDTAATAAIGRRANSPRGRLIAQAHPSLDASLLMLYGHILFTSTSYTHSLSMCIWVLSGTQGLWLTDTLRRLFPESSHARP